MNAERPIRADQAEGRGPAKDSSRLADSGFGPSEYSVRTGLDVTADNPATATLAAVEQMRLRDPEAFCFHVEHLRTGRRWYVDLSPGGEIDVQDWDECADPASDTTSRSGEPS